MGSHVQLVPRSWANFAPPAVPEALSTALAPVPSPPQASTEPVGPAGSLAHSPLWPREAPPQVTYLQARSYYSFPSRRWHAVGSMVWLLHPEELESYAVVLPASIVGTGWDSCILYTCFCKEDSEAIVAESMASSLGAADAPRVTNSRTKA
jgi:hypothetical protein